MRWSDGFGSICQLSWEGPKVGWVRDRIVALSLPYRCMSERLSSSHRKVHRRNGGVR